MTKDDIIKLALESGLAEVLAEHASEYRDGWFENSQYPELLAFAALAAAAEREACAKLVDHILKAGGGTYGDAIRARGQA